MSRLARCVCYKTAPSSSDLPFFIDRGPGSEYAKTVCVNCGYSITAHRAEIDVRRQQLFCTSFKSGRGHVFDSYYCGCRGWD